MDEVRNRYLTDRVMTASPAQRVVMIYDRLTLDLTRAREATDGPSAGPHLGHAVNIVAELIGSLDMSAGGPALNLADIYGFLIGQLTSIRSTGDLMQLDPLMAIVTDLRDAFATVATEIASTASTASTAAVSAAANFGRVSAYAAGPAAAPAASAWVG